MVRFLVIGQPRHVVLAGVGIGEAVFGAAIDVELPIGPRLAHLVLERLYLRGRLERILGPVTGEDPGLHLAGPRRIPRAEMAMKADYAVNLGTVLVLLELFRMNGYAAQAFGILPYTALFYLGSRYVSFPKR